MTSVAILQARTSSVRLPAKVLLPVAGIPLVVLAARRASNSGRDIIVATSQDPNDDRLAETIENYNLTCFRGSLDNTLERVVEALAAYQDDTIVFRLTGDNVFPDGALLDELEQDFQNRTLDYLCCNGEPSGLPYGLSVEVTRLQHLREAHHTTTDDHDREHVTPYIRRKFGETFFSKYKTRNQGTLRCTIDTLEDYLRVQNVFRSLSDPVTVPWADLVERLATLNDAPANIAPDSKLILGTAQLGQAYGITNQTGQPDAQHAEILLKSAINNGVRYLDTARAYGNSEAIIGQCLNQDWRERVRIITKLSPLADCPQQGDDEMLNRQIEASIKQSCAALGQQELDIVLLHSASHLTAWHGLAWRQLLDMQQAGRIKHLGASVSTPEELQSVLQEPAIGFIQLPFNILDHRWRSLRADIEAARQQRNLVVHIRSIFLQGLLLSTDPTLWRHAHCPIPRAVQSWLMEQTDKYCRKGVIDLCLSYTRAQSWADGIIIGVEQMTQLDEIIRLFDSALLSEEALLNIEVGRPVLPEAFLDPAQWSPLEA